MIRIFSEGTNFPVPGDKLIEEFIGNARKITDRFSVAHMQMPMGWSEPGHSTEFDEIVIVLRGELTIESNDKSFKILGGQVCWIEPVANIVFCNTRNEICEYWAICIPAFSPDRVHPVASNDKSA